MIRTFLFSICLIGCLDNNQCSIWDDTEAIKNIHDFVCEDLNSSPVRRRCENDESICYWDNFPNMSCIKKTPKYGLRMKNS